MYSCILNEGLFRDQGLKRRLDTLQPSFVEENIKVTLNQLEVGGKLFLFKFLLFGLIKAENKTYYFKDLILENKCFRSVQAFLTYY